MAPTQSYLIAATPRSGSALLCDMLGDTGVAGRPAEHFADLARRPFGHVYEAAMREGTTPNGVFGTRLMWSSLPGLVVGLRSLPGLAGLHAPRAVAAAFPDLRCVQLLRGDKVAQAAALWVVSQHGEPQYSFQAIDGLVTRLVAQERAWTRWLAGAGFASLKVVHEDLVARPYAVVADVLEHLGLEPADVRTPRMRPRGDGRAQEWAARYRAERGAVAA